MDSNKTSNKIIRLNRTDDPTIAKDLKNGDMILTCMIHKPTRRKHILIFSKEGGGLLGVPIYSELEIANCCMDDLEDWYDMKLESWEKIKVFSSPKKEKK